MGISLIVRSLQARLCWFGRQLVHTHRRFLFGPPDHVVRNFNDRQPRWTLRWTLRCWPGIATHYVIRTVRKLPNPRFQGFYIDVTEHQTWYGCHFELPRPCWRSRELRRGSFDLTEAVRSLRPCLFHAEPSTVTKRHTPRAPAIDLYGTDLDTLAGLEILEFEYECVKDALEAALRDYK